MASSTPPPTSPAAQDRSLRQNRKGKQSRPSTRRQSQKSPAAAAAAAMESFPEQLRDADDSADDSDTPATSPPMAMNMNQSIFGLIAAAGSRVDFNDRFDGSSSSSSASEEGDADPGVDDTDDHNDTETDNEDGPSIATRPLEDLSKTTILQPPGRHTAEQEGYSSTTPRQDMFKSLSCLPRRKTSPERKGSSSSEHSEKQDAATGLPPQRPTPPAIALTSESQSHLPVMGRMLEARAEAAGRPSSELERTSIDADRASGSQGGDTALLARRLMRIFEFDQPEDVIQEYPCWLLQSVLLQGFLYITTKHICFYAYLPKKANVVAKSGFLSKSGKRNPKYNRYWFRLKGDVLSYYRDATNLYFPHGHIDLRFGISASVSEKDKDGLSFIVVTPGRTYNFRAESAPSAKEWVKSLQRVIFRSHNDGDSVKISLPVENVIDIEDTQMTEFAHTCKIRVIDNDETYAIDEYFFSFFTYGRKAIDVLKAFVDGATSDKRTVNDVSAVTERSKPGQDAAPANLIHDDIGNSDRGTLAQPASEPVKATLAPTSPHGPLNRSPSRSRQSSVSSAARASIDAIRQIGRSNADLPVGLHEQPQRRSFSGSRRSSRASSRRRLDETEGSRVRESSESFVQSSMDAPSYSNLAASSAEDNSASQILRDSVVFQSPTMRRSPSGSQSGELRGRTKDNSSSRAGTPLPAFGSAQAVTTGHVNLSGQEPLSRQQGASSAPAMQSITQMGAYPLQRAGALAGYLNQTGKRMSTLLATESMGYVEKVSGMWKGGHKHYDEPAGSRPDEDELERDSEGKVQTSMERFRTHFALPETERLQATYFGYILRVLPLYGKIYISDRSFCFRSLLPGTRTKLILPLKDIENVDKEKGFRFGYQGLVVVIRGHEEIFFEFGQAEVRDDCAITMLQALETTRYLHEAEVCGSDHDDDESAAAERDALKDMRQADWSDHEACVPRHSSLFNSAPFIIDENEASMLSFKPQTSLRVTCLTIGSRGDVQPYIALCKGLIAEGHQARIATHAEFRGWIESHGIEFRPVAGDPGELMQLCIENGTFTWAFLRVANATFRGWLDSLLDTAYTACKDSDVLIESPSAMAGIHIAEKLGIPYFRAFTMPWTRTRAYPHAFITPDNKRGGAFNYMTYVMFDNFFWKATAYQVNKWRNNTLKLPPTSLEKMQPNKVPFLYNFSPSVVAPPLDFSDWIRVTGYWFLDEGGEYEPPQELVDFMDKARADGKKLVYVGFGSIIVNDTAKMTQEVIDAVLKADVRCILSKGWSDRISSKQDDPSKPPPEEPPMPPEIHVIKSAPHDWLFKRIDAAAHHGGSGTTGASLRAGIPTIVRPFFGDQNFFASRVEDLGVGVSIRKWGTNSFGRALWQVTRNERMIVKARVLGEQIRKENGVETAIQCLYRDMEYAKSLIERKVAKNARARGEQNAAGGGDAEGEEEEEEAEESWTFVGRDEPDPDMVTTKLSEGLGGVGVGGRSLGSQVLQGRG